jgi:hypothetical protein
MTSMDRSSTVIGALSGAEEEGDAGEVHDAAQQRIVRTSVDDALRVGEVGRDGDKRHGRGQVPAAAIRLPGPGGAAEG